MKNILVVGPPKGPSAYFTWHETGFSGCRSRVQLAALPLDDLLAVRAIGSTWSYLIGLWASGTVHVRPVSYSRVRFRVGGSLARQTPTK